MRNADVLIGERMIGYIVHLMGDQPRARRHLERMLTGYMAPVTGAEIIRFVFDQRAIAQCFVARILWLQGSADQAIGLTKEIVEMAIAGEDGLSLCQTLVQGACPVALFVGDLEALEHYVTMLLDYSQRQALEFWQAFGRCFRSVLQIRRGQLGEGLAHLAAALEDLREIRFGVHYGVFLSEFADALGRAGRVLKVRAIEEALARADRNEERWTAGAPSNQGRYRAPGGPVQRGGRSREIFVESLDWPNAGDDRLAVRAATSLAGSIAGRTTAKARSTLAPVYAGFSEG